MTTNAQAALQAAATAYQGRAAASSSSYVLELAGRFKAWLDEQDEATRETPMSHHISCSSRKHHPTPGLAWNCDCTPQPYTP